MKAIITVIGKDKIGIIAAVSTALVAAGVNILDISQTIMQEIFTMTMVVDIGEMKTDFSELSDILADTGKKMGLDIRIQKEDVFNSMHRV